VIGALAGVLAEKEPPRLLVECHGVGYEVEVPMSTYLMLPPVGSSVRLRIHHVLREDASLLFGFASAEERELFRALLKVNGVGPKVALGILSGVSATDFRAAIAAENAAALTRIRARRRHARAATAR
jgi:holliday junction DNA helicase RuvA